jgi:hypothetical protein
VSPQRLEALSGIIATAEPRLRRARAARPASASRRARAAARAGERAREREAPERLQGLGLDELGERRRECDVADPGKQVLVERLAGERGLRREAAVDVVGDAADCT